MVDETKEVVIDVSVVGVDAAERAMRRVHRAARGDIDWVYVAWLSALMFLASFFGATAARAEDMHDIRGTKHGCIDVTATGGWDTVTSDLMEDSTSGSALAASLYWTEVLIRGGTAAVYLCLNNKNNCGTGTANKLAISTGATVSLPLRGVAPASASGVQAIAVYSGIGETFQVCGHFRVSP